MRSVDMISIYHINDTLRMRGGILPTPTQTPTHGNSPVGIPVCRRSTLRISKYAMFTVLSVRNGKTTLDSH